MTGSRGRPGTFKKSIEALKKAKNKGFKVCTNTSVYRWTENDELVRLFTLLKRLEVDGILVAPAFGYEA